MGSAFYSYLFVGRCMIDTDWAQNDTRDIFNHSPLCGGWKYI